LTKRIKLCYIESSELIKKANRAGDRMSSYEDILCEVLNEFDPRDVIHLKVKKALEKMEIKIKALEAKLERSNKK
jgi:hypothetical protein